MKKVLVVLCLWAAWKMIIQDAEYKYYQVGKHESIESCLTRIEPLVQDDKILRGIVFYTKAGVPALWHACLPEGFDPRTQRR